MLFRVCKVKQASYLWARAGVHSWKSWALWRSIVLSLSLWLCKVSECEERKHTQWGDYLMHEVHSTRPAKLYGIKRKYRWKAEGWVWDNCWCTWKERLNMRESSRNGHNISPNVFVSVPAGNRHYKRSRSWKYNNLKVTIWCFTVFI